MNEGGAADAIRWLGTDDCHAEESVGGKAASLSRLAARHLVPPGFAITALPASATIGDELAQAIERAYEELARRCGDPMPAVAVRSSAVDEDGAGSSFAGQHATYLNICGAAAVVNAVQRCIQSAESSVASTYREARGMTMEDVRIAVLVQQLVAADVAAVAFSANPVTGDRNEVMITSNWGLGESVVGGMVTPDMFIVRKDSLVLVMREVGAKEQMTVRSDHGTEEIEPSPAQRTSFSLSDEQAMEIARLTIALEVHTGAPVDVECAIAGGTLYLLQCRPITTLR